MKIEFEYGFGIAGEYRTLNVNDEEYYLGVNFDDKEYNRIAIKILKENYNINYNINEIMWKYNGTL